MPTMNQFAPASISRRTPRPLTATDAGVPSAIAGVLVLIVTALAYFAVTLLDRGVHRGLDGPHVVPVTRALVAVVIGLGTAVAFYWRWVSEHMIDALYTTEDITPEPAPGVEQVVAWEMPTGPHQLERGRLLCSPGLLLEWAQAAVDEQSLSYATWAERFGGDRKYARFLQGVVNSGLGTQSGGRGELKLTRKGWALFSQAVTRDPETVTPLLERWPLLQARDDDDG
jgi:hypothetical protein